MVRKVADGDIADFIHSAEEFLSSAKFDSFVHWVGKAVERNAQALLSTNPANHVYDLEDGTMDLQLEPENVARKLEQQLAQAETNFAFPILKEGPVTEVLAFIATMQGDKQLEAVMAFYVRGTGQYVSSTEQWRRLCERFGWGLSSDIHNPFYRRVCEGILQKFGERGWI